MSDRGEKVVTARERQQAQFGEKRMTSERSRPRERREKEKRGFRQYSSVYDGQIAWSAKRKQTLSLSLAKKTAPFPTPSVPFFFFLLLSSSYVQKGAQSKG